MPERVLLVVHGANVRRSTYRYMRAMTSYFVEAGCTRTYPFHWNGSVKAEGIAEAGEHLAETMDLLAHWFDRGDGLDFLILAKSTGGLVVRDALARLDSAGRPPLVSTFLQIAVPNPPSELDSLVAPSRTVNIYSPDDAFLQFFINVGLFPRHTKRLLGASCDVLNIEIPGVSHHDMNWNTQVGQGEYAGRSLYDIYLDILEGGGGNQSAL
jgi:hypothetical protein